MSFLRRLWNRVSSKNGPGEDSSTAATAPLRPSAEGLPEDEHEHISFGMAQSVGVERDHNEDAMFVLVGNSAGHEPIPDFGMFVVADGMGGHRSGELASAISVNTVARHLTEGTILKLFQTSPERSETGLHDLLRDALEDANRSVVSQVPGGGTTLTAAILLGEQMTIGHVGDSRAYYITNGVAEVITRDHSLVERLRELGQLTPAEAATHPQRNVLYRAIGQGDNLEVDVATHPIPRGGYLLLCSDGLWGEVPDEKIKSIIYEASHPQQACEELVRAANAAGGPDNITAVLVRFPAT